MAGGTIYHPRMAVLSNAQLADIVRRHWPDGVVAQTGIPIRVTAYAVARAEACCTDSVNGCFSGARECSIGQWQINIWAHPQFASWNLKDPEVNADAAVAVSNNGTDWNPWCTWEPSACGGRGNDSYRAHIDEATRALQSAPPPQCPPGWSGTPPDCVAPPSATPPTLASAVVCSGTTPQIRYTFSIFDGLPTYLVVAPNAYFSPRVAFLGPFTTTGSVIVTPPSPGVVFGVLNRFAYLPDTRVQDVIAAGTCGAPPVQTCPPGWSGTPPNCVPPPPAAPTAGGGVLAGLALAALAGGAIYVAQRHGGLHRLTPVRA